MSRTISPHSISNHDDRSHDRTQLRILSLNVWGLLYISVHRTARITAIAETILSYPPSSQPHIVCLQELFVHSDFLALASILEPILPYTKYYHSGCFGSGLAILSKWPIQEAQMMAYPLNGRPTAFWRGDWYVGKGVATARIWMPEPKDRGLLDEEEQEKAAIEGIGGRWLEILNTHLHAPYHPLPQDTKTGYYITRISQTSFFAKLARAAAQRQNTTVIAAGDFNITPCSLPHRVLTTIGNLTDSWRVVYPESSLGAASTEEQVLRKKPVPTVAENLNVNGATCDSLLNTWRWPKAWRKRRIKGEKVEVDMQAEDRRAKRLDYIFVGGGNIDGVVDKQPKLPVYPEIEAVKMGMTDRHSSLGCSLSDHFSVEVSLRLPPSTRPGTPPQRPPASSPSTSHQQRLSTSDLNTILSLTSAYIARETNQRTLRLSHFVLSIVISVACLIGIWWSPKPGISFMLCFVSTINLAAGVIDGLIGGLFMTAELGQLREFEAEIGRLRGDRREEGEMKGGS